jgi:hypothetical protein
MNRLNDDDISNVQAFIDTLGKGGRKRISQRVKSEFKDLNLTLKEVEEFLPQKQVKVPKQRHSMKMFNNYIGGWYFDIMYSRCEDKKEPKLYGIYINGNSKFVHAIFIPNRRNITLKAMDTIFKDFCKGDNMKVVKIISDKERGLTGLELYEQFTAREEHHKFGIVDGFMNAVRYWNENQGYGRGITLEHLKEFIERHWNEAPIPCIGCTRYEMAHDEDLEKAYICRMLYGNIERYNRRDEIEEGAEVSVKYDAKKGPFERRHIKNVPGKFVVKAKEKDRVIVEDEDGNEEEVYYNQIRGIARKVDEEEILKTPEPNNEIYLEKVPEIKAPKNLDKEVDAYDKNFERIRNEVLMEVQNKLEERREMDLSLGFQPETRVEPLNRMFEKGKREVENNMNKYLVGFEKYKQNLSQQRVKKLANEIMNLVFGTGGNPYPHQDLQKTNANDEAVMKGAEKIKLKMKKQNAFINPQIKPELDFN